MTGNSRRTLRQALAGTIGVCFLLASGVALAQPPAEYHVSPLRRRLAESLAVDVGRLRLNLPPIVDVQLGEMVSLTAEGHIERIDRLDEQLFESVPGQSLDQPIRDDIPLKRGSVVWEQLFDQVHEDRRDGGLEASFASIESRELRPRDAARFDEALHRSAKAAAAQRSGKPLWLVTHVFRGRVELAVFGPAAEDRPAVRQGWDATPPSDRLEPWKFVSREPVTIAFLGERLVLRLAAKGPASAVERQPGKVSENNAPPWERVRLARAMASVNGEKEKPPEIKTDVPKEKPKGGHQVTVLYGTCRELLASPPSYWQLWKGFLWTTNGLATAAVLVVAGLAILLGLGYAARLTLRSTVAVVIVGGLLYALAASVDSYTRQQALGRPGGQYANTSGALRYGIATVSVPAQRDPGEFNTPFSVYVIRLPEDPKKHFVITELEENRDAFFRELHQKVAASAGKSAFIFIHGFNVPFEDAVKRTAQLAVDLQFDGAPMCYTWPSQGDLAYYVRDSSQTDWAAGRFREFLDEVQSRSGAKEIHLIAHSMGNRVLTGALREMGSERLAREDCALREIVLTAPDINADVFERDIVPRIRNSRQRITLYASSHDLALNRSYELNGVPRAGMAGDHLVVVPGVETVDVSALDTGFLGHSYYGDHVLVVTDMLKILREHLEPPRRGLKEQRKGDLSYWRFSQ
jgi:esterase/lipase superfamily enzyme